MRMKTIAAFATLLLTLVVLAPQGAAANPAQSGSNSLCEDYNVLYNVDGVYSPLAAMVTVDGASGYTISADQGDVYVDFYDANGVWLTYNNGAASGITPAAAVVGTICVAVGTLGYPDVPAVGATWTYQDGF